MPTQRPFLQNFLAAFRPQPFPKTQPSIPSNAAAAAATLWTAATQTTVKTGFPGPETTIASPKPTNPKTNLYSAQTSSAPQDWPLVAALPPLQHTVSPQTHFPRSSPSPGLPTCGPPNRPQPSYPTPQEARRSRRGSECSMDSGGFREVRTGGEKWFIGGLTASGEEKYYKLSMVKRDKSEDRLSTDRMSL